MSSSNFDGLAHMAGNLFGRNFVTSPTTTQVSHSTKSDALYQLYRKYLELDYDYYDVLWQSVFGKDWKTMFADVDMVLPPTEIQYFVQSTASCEQHRNYVALTGLFTTKLISNAYEQNNTSFRLDLRGLKPLDFLCYKIQKRDEPLTIIIYGKVGDYFANSTNGTFYVQDIAGHGIMDTTGTFHIEDVSTLNDIRYYIGGSPKPDLFFFTPNQSLYLELSTKGFNCTHLSRDIWQQRWDEAERKHFGDIVR